MKRPFWTHVVFAWVVAGALLVSATYALKGAVLYARLKVPPLERFQHDNTKAVLLLLLSMLLVVAAIVLPLVIRRRAQLRLGEVVPTAVKLVLFLGLALPGAQAAEKPASVDSARRHVIELTRSLEANPLGDKDRSQRTEVLKWWMNAPVTLKWCSELLVEATNEKTRAIVVTQGMFGAGVRLLEAGDKPPSQSELAAAGVESALNAYRNAVKADKSYADKFYDDLAADPRKTKGYVAGRLESCARTQPK
jgi:hypothetical protein